MKAPWTGLLTCASSATFPKLNQQVRLQWIPGQSAAGGTVLAEFMTSLPELTTEGRKRGALTVAGQWRSFTAFPSILAIVVVNWQLRAGVTVMSWKRFP